MAVQGCQHPGYVGHIGLFDEPPDMISGRDGPTAPRQIPLEAHQDIRRRRACFPPAEIPAQQNRGVRSHLRLAVHRCTPLRLSRAPPPTIPLPSTTAVTAAIFGWLFTDAPRCECAAAPLRHPYGTEGQWRSYTAETPRAPGNRTEGHIRDRRRPPPPAETHQIP